MGVGLSATASFSALGEGGPTTGTGGLSIIITEVTGSEADDKISGRVTVTIDVERADYKKIALYVDGIEVDAGSSALGLRPPRSLHLLLLSRESSSICRSTRPNTITIRIRRR